MAPPRRFVDRTRRFAATVRIAKYKTSNHIKIAAMVSAMIVFYNEVLVYHFRPWPKLECARKDDCVRMLFVADPRISPELSDSGLIDRLLILDSDRYLTKTFFRAVEFTKPDVVIFLGNIIDDGALTSDKEFHESIRKLSSIFTSEARIKHVWIPGDRDIGGKNGLVYPEKLKRFNEVFDQPDFMKVKNADIYKVNAMTMEFPKRTDPPNGTSVVVSHFPLLLSPGKFTEKVFMKIKPAIIFSGHKLSAYHLETTLDAMFVSKVIAITPQDKDNTIKVNFKHDTYHEFIVPTCSYRAGVPNTGFAAGIIDGAKQFTYSVLWLPRRLEQFHTYMVVVISGVLYGITVIVYKLTKNMFQYGLYSRRR